MSVNSTSHVLTTTIVKEKVVDALSGTSIKIYPV